MGPISFDPDTENEASNIIQNPLINCEYRVP